MRTVTLSTAVLLLGTGIALAGPGAGQPREPADPPSGRPAAVLDQTQCAELWSTAGQQGDALSQGQAAPYIVNFGLVDADGDGQISEAEFQEGCKQGLVQQAQAPQQPSGESVPEASEPIQDLDMDTEQRGSTEEIPSLPR